MKRWIAGLLLVVAACSPTITPKEQGELVSHAATLQHCQDVGRDAGSYAAYEGCKLEAGIK